MSQTLAEQIQRHVPVSPVPSMPDLRLHLAGPKSGLGRLSAGRAGPPYWAHVWAGGLMLARYLRDHPEAVIGRRVLDLGCGSGLVAIAAARSGADAVVAADIDAFAVAATTLNATLNDVAVTAILADLLDGPVPDVDLVLVGDLFYDAGLADRVITFLDRCIGQGRTALIGDPGRAPLPRHRLAAIHDGTALDFGAGTAGVASSVYVVTAP